MFSLLARASILFPDQYLATCTICNISVTWSVTQKEKWELIKSIRHKGLKKFPNSGGNWRMTFEFENGDAYVVDYEDYHQWLKSLYTRVDSSSVTIFDGVCLKKWL